MPKLPFKRKPADDAASISSYIPSQMVDYTSLPPIDEDTALTKFNRMPLIARVGVILLPILLLLGAAWGVAQALGTPETQAQAPETPVITISKAQAVSREAIAIEGQTQHVAPGTKVSARLLSGDEAIDWADPEQSTATVENGAIELRMSKADSWEAALTSDITYTVELTVGEGEKAVTASSPLIVPEMLASAFFGPKVEPTPIPSPSPTLEPTPEPTPEPVVAGPPTLSVVVDSTMLISPTLRTAEIGGVQAGATFEPMLRSDDSKWFLVKQGEQVGWLHADQVKIDGEAATKVATVRPDPAKVEAGPLKGTVFNGGNIRYRPNVQTGTVLGQLHARQVVTLSAKTADGNWYKVIAPEAEGWVSASLLTIDAPVVGQVPTQ